MKKAIVVFLSVSFLLMKGIAYGAEKMLLGQNNFAIKVDHMHFDDSKTDNGIYVGAEGFKEVDKNLYLGFEAGYTSNDGKVKQFGATLNSDVIFIPIELNLKHVVRIANNVMIDVGIGGSYNYVKEELSGADSLDEWLFGGQGFADMNVTVGKVFMGVNYKIQFTDKGRDTGKNYSNQRIGGQIGIVF